MVEANVSLANFIKMIDSEIIKSFLEGNDPEEFIVACEFDYASDSIFKIKEIPGKGKEIRKDTFTSFCWVGDLHNMGFYQNSKGLQKEAMTKHGIVITKLETHGDPRMEMGLTFMVKSLKGYRSLIQFFREGGADPWGEKFKEKILLLPPVEQYFITKEKRLFKGFENYDDVTRMVFDLETTSLEPKDGRIFMIGIRTNKGYNKIIECIDEENEIKGLREFFDIINELKPSIIGGYNSANFDWYWIFERCKILKIDIRKIVKSLHPQHSISQKKNLLKLANDVEEFQQTTIWGYNNIDIIHAVRRAQAINSSIKSAGLKYISEFINAKEPDRIYINHENIGKMYTENTEHWLNLKTGEYRKKGDFTDLHIKFPDTYLLTGGADLVERYLQDDLEETLKVDKEFNQASFFLATMIPTTYERVSTMGTATLWKMLMLAWSYKNNLAVPSRQGKTEFVGGLSRLLKVGYSKDVLKLDFSSLYPSIQLVHDVFPACDVTGAMKGMLKYFRDARIKYKQLSEEYYTSDRKKSETFGNKQLPIKIFINSMFGALSAPHVFPWGDMYMGEQITCTGRQYLRQMIKFFGSKGYVPLVMDTDGVNFSLPEGANLRTYTGRGLNWKVQLDKVYTGPEADVAEYNDIFMRGEMALDTDGVWPSCINLARKNYAVMDFNGKVKLTGNSIKSKKLPGYIEKFLDKGIKLLLEGNGKEFVDYYYEYLEKIFNHQIPLAQIAQKARVRLAIDDYKYRCTQTTKAGSLMSRQAHMELAIEHNLNVSLGDVILYVNNGEKASHGDVQKVSAKKYSELQKKKHFEKTGEVLMDIPSFIKLNSYMLDNSDLENNPTMTGDYNVARAIATFNKRIEPLLVCFKDDVRKSFLVNNPEDMGIFTFAQCELINGIPLGPGDQDEVKEVMMLSEGELKYWDKRGLSSDYIYELAEEGWESYIYSYET